MKSRGFTLFELLVALAIVGVIMMIAAPSFRGMIEMQRLRGASAQLVTDLQFARGEAVSRGKVARVALGADAAQTCYVIYFSAGNGVARCNCLLGAGSACPAGASWEEVRTVVLNRSDAVSLAWPNDQDVGFGYSQVTGGLISIPNDAVSTPLPSVQIDVRIDDARRLRTNVVSTGRPTVCAPNPQRMQVVAC
jgi:type IV fimbrial biogenesis protein FimT